MPMSSLILGMDLVPIKAVRGTKTLVGDITTQQARQVQPSRLTLQAFVASKMLSCFMAASCPESRTAHPVRAVPAPPPDTQAACARLGLSGCCMATIRSSRPCNPSCTCSRCQPKFSQATPNCPSADPEGGGRRLPRRAGGSS